MRKNLLMILGVCVALLAVQSVYATDDPGMTVRAGLFGAEDCPNNLSVYIKKPHNIQRATFHLFVKTPSGWLPTDKIHDQRYGIVENVTVQHTNVQYHGFDVYYFRHAVYFGAVSPVGALVLQILPPRLVHLYAGQTTSDEFVSSLEIIHGDGSYLSSVFEDLDPGKYKVRVTGISANLQRLGSVWTDKFVVVECDPTNPCPNPVLDEVALPFYGQITDAIATVTSTCVGNVPLQAVIYYNINSPDPWYGPFVGVVNADGTAYVDLGPGQAYATDFDVWLAPVGAWLPGCQDGCLGRPEIPGALSLRSIQRFPKIRLEELVQIDPGTCVLSGTTNCDPTFYKLSCYLWDDTRWVPQPEPAPGAESSFKANADGTFTIMLTWPNWTFGHVQNLRDDAIVQSCWPPADGLCTGGPLNAFDWVGTPLDFTPEVVNK